MFWRKKKKDNKPEDHNQPETDVPETEETAVDVPKADAEHNVINAQDAPVADQAVDVDAMGSVPEEVKQVPSAPPAEVTDVPSMFTQSDDEKEEPEEQKEIAEDKSEERKEGWLKRLGGGLSKSTNKLTQGINDLVTKKKLDQDLLDELEDLLIMADLGPKAASKIVEEFGAGRFGKEISDEEVKEALAGQIEAILAPVAKPFDITKPKDGGVRTVLVSGVNGVGKTTTIGKMANRYKVENGKKVMMAAGDTFRAAAVEQLKIWAERAGCEIIAKDIGADAAAVAYEALAAAEESKADLLFIDTAGRLHNKSNLMAELEKVVRVLKKKNENAPHDVLLVLDATTGQNAFEQVRIFSEMVNVTGLIITKLDGSAKGGVVVGLADEFGLPIHLIGVGETMDDLQAFNARDFARSLLGV